MQNATGLPAFNTNPYFYPPAPLSPTGPTAPLPYFSPPNVSLGPNPLIGPNNDVFNYTVANPNGAQAQNINYPLSGPTAAPISFLPSNVSVAGPVGSDAFTSPTTPAGAPFTYTTTPTYQPPFVAPRIDTTALNNQNFQVKLADAFNTNTTNVGAIPPVTNYAPQVMAPNTTMIPGYTPPGGNFNMLA